MRGRPGCASLGRRPSTSICSWTPTLPGINERASFKATMEKKNPRDNLSSTRKVVTTAAPRPVVLTLMPSILLFTHEQASRLKPFAQVTGHFTTGNFMWVFLSQVFCPLSQPLFPSGRLGPHRTDAALQQQQQLRRNKIWRAAHAQVHVVVQCSCRGFALLPPCLPIRS